MPPETPSFTHIPVLLEETLDALNVQPGGRYIDGTVGAGGHSAAILERSAPGGQLLGLDADPQALDIARAGLARYGKSVLLVNENFADIEAVCIKNDFFPVHGILFDLGLASFQVDREERGFSFQREGPLDMRVNPSAQKTTAADIVNTYPESALAELLRTYGEENFSHRIARRIIQERPIRSTLHLAQIVEQAMGGRREKIHPATRTFQALRIAVNRELENLESALKQAVSLLGYEDRLVVISYHSLEDRIVKQFVQRESRDCICSPQTPICVCGHVASLRMVTRKVITPSSEEVRFNPRSRSARLRVAERIINQDAYYRAVEDEGFSDDIDPLGWKKPALLRKLRVAFTTSCN